MRSKTHETNSLEDHIDLIRERIDASRKDPQTRALASSIVSGSFDEAKDPRDGQSVPVLKYHGRHYRGALNWKEAGKLCKMRDYMCEVVSIWNFAVLNVRYTADPTGQDYYQDLRTILETGAADCDDTCVLFGALLPEVGYDVNVRVISVDGQKWQHIYPVVILPSRGKVPLDMTEPGKQPGWEYPHPKAMKEFEV